MAVATLLDGIARGATLMSQSSDASAIDAETLLFGPGAANEPHDAYGQLREQCPVARTDGEMASVYISDYESVQWALHHPEVFSSGSDALSIGQEQLLIPLQVDPPLHTQYRRLLNPPFTPKRIAEMEPDIRRLVTDLLDTFADRGACDFHEEFATPLPSTIFLRLMGLPLSDLDMLLQFRDDTVRPAVEPGDFEGATAIRAAAARRITEYLEQAIATARRKHVVGLIGEMVHAEFEGRPLSDAELLGICHLMLLGGLDTVTATLDCMIVYLAEHADHRRQLVEDPSLISHAVEELLRHQSPVQVVPRVVTRPIILRDVELSPGDGVMLVVGAANTDENAFADPGTVELDRDTHAHVAFGGGNHLCLGLHLARLELRVALEEFHRRIPDYRIVDGAEIQFSFGIRQAEQLPLVWA
jgi:cytochrome P450